MRLPRRRRRLERVPRTRRAIPAFVHILKNGRPDGDEGQALSMVEDASIGPALKRKTLQPGAQSELNEQQYGKEPSF